jgi:hypothetical protein
MNEEAGFPYHAWGPPTPYRNSRSLRFPENQGKSGEIRRRSDWLRYCSRPLRSFPVFCRRGATSLKGTSVKSLHKILALSAVLAAAGALTGCIASGDSTDDSMAAARSQGGSAADTGKGSIKVDVCHIPPGNPANMHVITVGAPAVEAHLAHGDNLGACPEVPPTDTVPPNDNKPPKDDVPPVDDVPPSDNIN